jgi:hypothetical protein
VHFLKSARSLLVPTLCLGAASCSLDAAPPSEELESSTYASVRIERSEPSTTLARAAELPRAEALAGFVRVPALVDPVAVTDLVGLSQQLPAPGSCETRGAISPAGPLSEATQVEFIDAGSVTLEANGASTRLAPYAFPTVTDSMSGVLYSTRDRASEPLPAGLSYTLSADGLRLSTDSVAPTALGGVTLGGVPLRDTLSVPAGQPLDLTWNVGAAGDFVYAELAALGGSERVLCTFQDDVGAGTVPGAEVLSGAEFELSLHRLRMHEFESPQVDWGRLFFDFEVTHRIVVR